MTLDVYHTPVPPYRQQTVSNIASLRIVTIRSIRVDLAVYQLERRLCRNPNIQSGRSYDGCSKKLEGLIRRCLINSACVGAWQFEVHSYLYCTTIILKQNVQFAPILRPTGRIQLRCHRTSKSHCPFRAPLF